MKKLFLAKMMVPFVAALTGFAAPSSLSAATVLTFDTIGDLEAPAEYYNGGYGDLGTGPGPTFGVSIGPGGIVVLDSDVGGSGNITSEPSPSAVLFLDSDFAVNVLGGFDTGIAFFYAAPNLEAQVSVYDGFDGLGNLLAAATLPLSPIGAGDPSGDFGPFEAFGLGFSGTARSVIFSSASGQFALDNLTLESVIPILNPTPGVPEPATWLQLIAGFVMISVAARVKRRVAI